MKNIQLRMIMAMRKRFYNRVMKYSLDRYHKPKHKMIAMAMMYGASPTVAYRNANRMLRKSHV